MFYHGVLTSCNGFTYSMGAAILDKDEPWKVLHRADSFLLAPHELYECVGDVPNVVFPCAALADAETGRIASITEPPIPRSPSRSQPLMKL